MSYIVCSWIFVVFIHKAEQELYKSGKAVTLKATRDSWCPKSNESFYALKLGPAALPVPLNMFIFLFSSAFFILSVINEPPVEFSESSNDLEASSETVRGLCGFLLKGGRRRSTQNKSLQLKPDIWIFTLRLYFNPTKFPEPFTFWFWCIFM